MNESLLIIGTILFAFSGAYSFLVENFFPLAKVERRLRKKKAPGDAIEKAARIKQTARSVFFLIWAAGFVVTILGIAGN